MSKQFTTRPQSKSKSVKAQIRLTLCSCHLFWRVCGGELQSFVTGTASLPLSLSPWAFTSSYAKHVLLSSDSSAVCCHDTFFLHFSLTVTFMFICSVQLWGIWRGCLPPLTSFLFFFSDKNINADLHSIMTKPMMNSWIFGNMEAKHLCNYTR